MIVNIDFTEKDSAMNVNFGEVNVISSGGGIPIPETAKVGQTIIVEEVDENGKPTKWKAADFPKNEGTVKSVNNVEPDENGNVEIEVGGELVQSDWKQNDPEQPDYVKNRPFYSHTEGEADYLVEPMDLQFVYGEAYPDNPIVVNPDDFAKGNVLYVVWDGTVYECTVKYHNMAMFNYIGGEDEPFTISDDNGTGELRIDNAQSTFTGTVSFALAKSLAKTTLVPLDMKYLPIDNEISEDGNGLVKNSTIAKAMKNAGAQADWEENDETNPAYIKNRPFYQSVEGNYLVEPMTLTFEVGSTTPNESLPDINLDPETGYEVMWGNNQYMASWYWHEWAYEYIWRDQGQPFTMGHSPLTVTRKDTSVVQQITFAVGNPLPKYQPMPEQYLPKLSGATADSAGTHGIVPAPPIGGQDLVLLGNGEWGHTAANMIKVVEGNKTNILSLETGIYLLTGSFRFNYGTTEQQISFDEPTLAICKPLTDSGDRILVIFDGNYSETSIYKKYELLASGTVHSLNEYYYPTVLANRIKLISTDGSKTFNVTVDNNGVLTTTEVV